LFWFLTLVDTWCNSFMGCLQLVSPATLRLKKSTPRRKGARAQRINGVCLADFAALAFALNPGHAVIARKVSAAA
jgi:hypothetical protein